jgi:DNA-directed RNA polymerase I subunit RPA12
VFACRFSLISVAADTGFLQEVITQSKPSDFPSPLRQKLSNVQVVERHKVQTEAKTKQTCPKCGNLEVFFTTAQIRSADEGSTVFYRCSCGFKCVSLAAKLI